jgi:hypothetical protein
MSGQVTIGNNGSTDGNCRGDKPRVVGVSNRIGTLGAPVIGCNRIYLARPNSGSF